MPERLSDDLFVVTPDQKKAEENLPGGHVPERWLTIEKAEKERMIQVLEGALQLRKHDWGDEELGRRLDLLQKHMNAELELPSFAGGPYALKQWLNLSELMSRILDLKTDQELVPTPDSRIPFSSDALDRKRIILRWLRDKIHGALSEEDQLTQAQIEDVFTNISQQQLNKVIQVIADSGLAISSETFEERFKKAMKSAA